jgi:NADH dehydrogenase FAD-containing subunit
VTKVAERHQVLVVGGGFGGLSVTKSLARTEVDVTIVDRTNHHLFQPLLYQVATGILSEGVIGPPLRGVIKNQANARTVLAEVTRFDLDTKTVHGVSPDGRPLQRCTQRRLTKMGVEVRVNTAATAMSDDSITVKGPEGLERIAARTKIWAAGVQASPLAKMLADATGAQTDRAGRVAVRPDCTLPGHPEVFAIGDMVSLNGLPGVAQPAMQEGKYVGKVIRARLKGTGTVAPFKYFDKGSMATIGRNAAVADAFGMKFTGPVGYLMWGFIHVLYLIGWSNRIITLYSWLRALSFTHHRGERIITVEQAHDELTRATTRRDGDEFNRLLSKRA